MTSLTVLRKSQSRLPSSVYILNAKPRVSRTVSAESARPATVENRQKRSVFVPGFKKAAEDTSPKLLSVTSKNP